MNTTLENCPLGKTSLYQDEYTPTLLYPVSRNLGRDQLEITNNLPFEGIDLWNSYELSWLDLLGKPHFTLATLTLSCRTPNLIESKSLKLYLNSFNQTKLSSKEELKKIIEKDLSLIAGGPVNILFTPPNKLSTLELSQPPGLCIDSLTINTSSYYPDPSLLQTTEEQGDEILHSYLLKSNCLITGQPDWASLIIRYKGAKIDHASLLKYIISYRKHAGFHEHCVEKIYCDLLNSCKPSHLTVFARYTRRGGLDINPFRSNFETLDFTSQNSYNTYPLIKD